MARHEKNFEAVAETRLAADELCSLAGRGGVKGEAEALREGALACFLSGSDGWDAAGKALGGAFSRSPILKGDEN